MDMGRVAEVLIELIDRGTVGNVLGGEFLDVTRIRSAPEQQARHIDDATARGQHHQCEQDDDADSGQVDDRFDAIGFQAHGLPGVCFRCFTARAGEEPVEFP